MSAFDSIQAVNDKLILLYIYAELAVPINPMEVADVIIKLDVMEYFNIGHYSAELVNSGMIENIQSDNQALYLITQSGINTLALFRERLDSTLTTKLDEQISQLKQQIKKNRFINSSLEKIDDSTYIVTLRMMEGDVPLIELSLSVISNTQANQLIKKWQTSHTDIYASIIKNLLSE